MLMTTDPGDLVLDPTCGSGTTAYVAEQLARRWITTDETLDDTFAADVVMQARLTAGACRRGQRRCAASATLCGRRRLVPAQ